MISRQFLIGIFFMATTLTQAQKSQFSPEDLLELKQISNLQVSCDKTQAFYNITVNDLKENKSSTSVHLLDLKNGTAKEFANKDDELKGIRWVKNGIAGTITKDDEKQIVVSPLDRSTQTVYLTKSKEDLLDFKFSPDMQ